jgi:hypothetical protein
VIVEAKPTPVRHGALEVYADGERVGLIYPRRISAQRWELEYVAVAADGKRLEPAHPTRADAIKQLI